MEDRKCDPFRKKSRLNNQFLNHQLLPDRLRFPRLNMDL
jgi:hypothetical protein